MNTHRRRNIVRTAAVRPAWWLAIAALVLGAGIAAVRPAAGQDAAPVATVSASELAELVGPIALYPDDLVAIVLPASTYPLQVVQAARFLEERKRNANLAPNEEWDDSVVALLNYPEVVALLNDDLDWTYDLGTAVLNQRADVLDAIQDFRDRAYAAGNLRSDDRQTVTRADNAIAIKPADPQVIYVPYYEPARVVVYQTIPVYHYYPWRYPVYYYPYPASYVFDTGFFWGVRSWFSIGWHTHHVHVYDWGYSSHPYFGWRYYEPWYVRNVYVNVNVNRGNVWEPRHRYGGRPVVRGYEGRVYTSNEPPRASRGGAGSTYRNRSTEGPAARPSGDAERANRGGAAGSAYRDRSAAATERPAARGAGEADRASRGTAESAYRSRSVESTERARAAAEANRARSPELASPRALAAPRPAPAERNGADASGAAREGSYRSGGRGLSQAFEGARTAAPSREPRAAVGAPSVMPREATRGVETRSSPPQAAAAPSPSREQRYGGNPAPREGTAGGSYRGSGGGRGEDRGGGARQPPARSGQGRSAAR